MAHRAFRTINIHARRCVRPLQAPLRASCMSNESSRHPVLWTAGEAMCIRKRRQEVSVSMCTKARAIFENLQAGMFDLQQEL